MSNGVVSTTPDIKYTDKDFPTARTALVADAQNRFPDVNTDYSSPSYITMFIEFIAYLIATISLYLNARSREWFFPLLTERESAVLHSVIFDFTISSRIAATTTARVTHQNDAANDTLISAGSVFGGGFGEGAADFRSLADVTLLAGAAGSFVEVITENSLPLIETFVADGSARQFFRTSANQVLLQGIDGTGSADPDVFKVEVGAVQFDIVENFLNSESTDPHCTVSLDNDGRAIIRFGDGITGLAPLGVVTITGRRGGGSGGNGITVTRGPALRDILGNAVAVSFSNPVLSSGGADEPTVAEIKEDAPASLRASNRTVSPDDFVSNVEAISGVDRALALTSNDDPAIDENKSEIVVLSDSPTNASMVGGNAAAVATTDGVDDQFFISINGETPQLVDLGAQVSGEDIAAEIQTQVQAMVPEHPLDNAEAYSNFLAQFNVLNVRYEFFTGQAGLAAQIAISAGTFDASVPLKIDTAQQQSNTLGAAPGAGTIAAIIDLLTNDKPVTNTHVIEVFSPGVEIILVDASVRFDASASSAALKAAVRDAIRARLYAFFSPRHTGLLPNTLEGVKNDEIDFGNPIRFSDLIAIVNQTDGVESVNETNFVPAADVAVTTRAFPVLGGIIIRDNATGNPV
jgi:hypothetical protein